MASTDGFLSETQREYLMGNHEPPSDSAERKMRSDIRERTKIALEEFERIAHGMEEKDMEQILFDSKADFEWEEWERAQGEVDNKKMHLGCMSGVLTFFYLATLSDHRPFLEIYIQRAIKRAYSRRNQAISFGDIDVSITVNEGEKAAEIDTDDLSQLSQHELTVLINSGEIGPKRLVEAGEENVGHLGYTQEVLNKLADEFDIDQ